MIDLYNLIYVRMTYNVIKYWKVMNISCILVCLSLLIEVLLFGFEDFLAIYELAFIYLSRDIFLYSVAIFEIILELSLVNSSIYLPPYASTLSNTIYEISFIITAICPYIFPKPMRLALFVWAYKFITIYKELLAFSTF